MEVEGPIVETWPPAGQEILFGGVPTEPIKGATNADPNAQLHSRPLIPADPRVRQTDWPPGGNKWKLLAGSINHKAKFVARDYSQRRQRIINRILAGKHEPAKPMPDYQSAPHNLPIGTPLPTYGGEPIYEDAAFPTVVRTQAFASTDPKADADRLIRRMLPLAFRRPVSKAMADRYVALVHDWIDEGVDFESAMRTGYKAIFTSPQFLFHQSSLPDETGKSVSLDDHALAERLAYFLWGSSPDEQLSQLAAEGQLSRGDTLREQTERMLADTRSNRFVEDFLGQWLDLHEINFTSPDLNLYPEYDPVLHWSMLHESHSFFRRLIDRDLPARNLIDSEFVTINRRLAQHYDLPAVEGMQASVVSVPADSVRGGVMTQAAVMKVTANGTNTSPVVRGVWVLERILGKPSPPPPPGIPAVEPDIRGAVTILQQLEKHRSDTACASCHARIDPPGVALEHFDPVGRFRTHYRVLNSKLANTKARPGRKRYQTGLPVDASYHLPGGQSFEDIRELKKIYAGDQAAIARMLAEHLLVYATGATTTFADDEAINQIVQQSAADEFGVRSLIHNVIQSKIFQSR